MTEIFHTEITYQPYRTSFTGRCRVDIWPLTIEPLHEGFIIVTELADNPGPSITNSIEAIAEVIEQELLHWPLIAYRLVEHYPARGYLPETFDLVELTRAPDQISRWVNPRWTHLELGLVDELATPGFPRPTEYFAQLAGPLSAGEGPPATTGDGRNSQEGGPLSEPVLPGPGDSPSSPGPAEHLVSTRKEGTLA